MITDCWQFNTVRVNHFVDWHWYNTDWELDLIEKNFANNQIVTILDLAHDAHGKEAGIGAYWLTRHQELIDLYTRYADKYKDNPYVWFELINEPGVIDFNEEAWLEIHQSLIQAIRATGNNNPIIVSGWCWGQDACTWGQGDVQVDDSAILKLGADVLNINDEPQHNIIFTHHVYDQFQYASASRLSNYHDAVLSRNYALIVGEYASANNNCTMKSTSYMFESVKPRGIGRIVWNWDGKDRSNLSYTPVPNALTDNMEGSGSGINSCINPTNLTKLGDLVWKDNHNL